MPKNSSFSDRVRSVVRAIQAGQTLSYKEVAAKAGNPKAARAVARVMSANYDPEIPCHRVIKSDGTLGGYNRGGSAAKHAILEREAITS
ncbi:6-O-methylguanine DNA methyltransferase [Candidatus Kaiserbacteria bacterium RIFCSPLOWO2_01_FULL_45_25]|uniref:6-O-methylguanine DNA methyltransferase n=1 Tax=Candidatus Kaiserbacteria bacterium RIFCSPLOWO2_12_FULL_45_26 TaxID=1798525 RepID=A0A1F6FGV7_9BACT|nr:MAG: 6-O-methylguanine DNA methyltransferase [Candidatus Kaiserbacteria bacterium RIFCSPHIGHO2_12_45_16]OGG69659.1 MAG: 6-O-methylguanine DNA methyltransferase [Candidatus Kaiserbacteria bacterium RIFCSPLOWO2_01_FULL_45_25]OGG85092.1 MAG: 6-O-methylguanine DNA methyltransferase [Candidatus Kaiserbacteria bacterium RIFCSPLOWO2_12_FULL_45_26]